MQSGGDAFGGLFPDEVDIGEIFPRHSGQICGQHRRARGHIFHGFGGKGVFHELGIGWPRVDQQRCLHFLFYNFTAEQHSAVLNPGIIYGLQRFNIISRAVNQQLSVRKDGLKKALNQGFQAIDFLNASGIQAGAGAALPGKRGLFFLHGNICMALQNDVRLPGGIHPGIHLLRQEHIVGAPGNDPVCKKTIELAVAQHIRQIRDDAYAAAAFFSGSQLGEQGGGTVQAVHKDHTVRPGELAYRGVDLPGTGENFAQRIAVGNGVLVVGTALLLRGKGKGGGLHKAAV